MTWLTIVLALWFAVSGIISIILTFVMIRRIWIKVREAKNLANLHCPKCKYPLRFNGNEYWCSECGYKFPVGLDPQGQRSKTESPS